MMKYEDRAFSDSRRLAEAAIFWQNTEERHTRWRMRDLHHLVLAIYWQESEDTMSYPEFRKDTSFSLQQ